MPPYEYDGRAVRTLKTDSVHICNKVYGKCLKKIISCNILNIASVNKDAIIVVYIFQFNILIWIK